jgi:hypothetical protein
MKIALFGNFMYELAIGLRENPENDVRLFLDSRTIPTCLRGEPMLDDPTFSVVAPWVGRKEILRPGDAEITERLSDFDVAIVTDLGPIFAECSATPFVFFPGGWDLTHVPFPVRSRLDPGRPGVAVELTSSRLSSLFGSVVGSGGRRASGRRRSRPTGVLSIASAWNSGGVFHRPSIRASSVPGSLSGGRRPMVRLSRSSIRPGSCSLRIRS